MQIPAAKQSPGRERAPLSSPVPSQHRAWCSEHTGHCDSTIHHPPCPLCTKKNRLCIRAQTQTSCAMSGAHRLLQLYLNPKKQLHCRKAELTFLFPKGGAAASEAERTLG